NHQIWLFLQQFIAVLLKICQKTIFEILLHIASRSGREIDAHHREMIEIFAVGTSFIIVVIMSASVFTKLGCKRGENSRAAISFLLSGVPIVLVAHLFQ